MEGISTTWNAKSGCNRHTNSYSADLDTWEDETYLEDSWTKEQAYGADDQHWDGVGWRGKEDTSEEEQAALHAAQEAEAEALMEIQEANRQIKGAGRMLHEAREQIASARQRSY